MENKSKTNTVEESYLLSGLRWSLKRCCPRRLRTFCDRVRSAFINAVKWRRRRGESPEHLASRELKRMKESSSSDEDICRDRKRRRGTANERDDSSQDLGQQGEQKAPEHLEQRMCIRGKVAIKRRRSQMESDVPAKRFRSLLPMSVPSFTFHALLGKGSFGRVMLASVPGRDSRVAVKIIQKKAMNPVNIIKERRVLEVARNSPFLCHGYAAFQTETCVLLIMEYLAGGRLMSYLNRMDCFPETTAAFYSAEIVCAVQFLHSQGIIHRDLKPDNILLDGEGHVKICDFGLVADGIFGTEKTREYCGTFMFMAPEIHLKQAYGVAVDWWSFGVVLFRMLNGAFPFYASNSIMSEIDQIVYGSPQYSKNLSKKAVDILKQLLEKDPRYRLGMKGNIRRHPFFQTINWDDIESRRSAPPYQPELRPYLLPNKLRRIPSVLQTTEDTSSPSSSRHMSGFTFITPDWMN